MRFALHVHKLLRLLDGFYITNDGNTPPDRALGEFTQEVIESACGTLCGRKVVSGGYLQPQKGNVLKLCKVSSNAQYDPKLAIPISPRKQPGPGPAAHAFKQTEIPYHPVYMPEREREEAWLAEVKTDGEYRFPPPTQVGWVAAEQPELQDFHSVLCVLTRHFTTDRTDNVGILTFSTRKRDPFLPMIGPREVMEVTQRCRPPLAFAARLGETVERERQLLMRKQSAGNDARLVRYHRFQPRRQEADQAVKPHQDVAAQAVIVS